MSETYNWDTGLLLKSTKFPKIAAEYQHLLDSNDFSALEDLLMERFDTAPQNIEFYLPAYRTFIKRQDFDRASTLLGLHIESLRIHHELDTEISLLQAILGLWQGCKFARDLLLDHLKTMYPQNTNFALFTQHLQILDEGSGVENFRQLELWLRYDEGRIIYMPSKGVGRIKEISLKFGVVRLALQNDEHLSLRIDEAERLAQPLVSSHFLTRTITEMDVLSQIAFNDPAELLRQLFASIRREVTMNELREMLSAVVSESQWSTWWARARKDSRLIVGSGTKPKLNWKDSISEGSADLMATFLKVSPYDKLEMLKKHATRSDSIASEMAQALTLEASHALQSDPSLALELILIVDSVSQCKDVAMPFTAVELITRAGTGAVIAGVKDRLARKKAVQIVALSRDDWPIIFSAQLKVETDISIFKLIYESLHNAGRADVLVPDVERALSDPPSIPRFYLWLCKEMSNRPELHKYANLDFLRTLFGILGDSAFKGHHPMLRKLFDPNEVVDRAIETLDAPAGRTLLDILSRDRELEEYIKESVRQKVFSIFPELRLSK